VDTETKVCTMCGEEKPLTSFRSRGGDMRHLVKSRCNSCLYTEHRRWVLDNPERVREYRNKDSWTLAKRCARRGITPEQLISAYERQEECCAICKVEIELIDSAIDHNHETGEFRGVLCKQCNRALGMFKDSPQVLKNAVEYLEAFGNYSNGN
jgi:hypothetical protein